MTKNIEGLLAKAESIQKRDGSISTKFSSFIRHTAGSEDPSTVQTYRYAWSVTLDGNTYLFETNLITTRGYRTYQKASNTTTLKITKQ